MTADPSTITEKLIASESFRDCLNLSLKLHYFNRGKKVNLSDFSRKADFSARSYVSELLSGKKGLSRDALSRITHALAIPRPYLQLLEVLACIENPRLRAKGTTERMLEKKLRDLRKSARTLDLHKPEDQMASPVIDPRVFEVYASLGTLEEGATFKEITARSALSPADIKRSLNILINGGLARQEDERYFAISSQADFFGLKTHQGLSSLVSSVCKDIDSRREDILNDSSSLVFHTAFTIDLSRQNLLKVKLREAIYKVLDEFQSDDGDRTQQLFVSLSARTP